MNTDTQNWNGREYTSCSCGCGYRSNYTDDAAKTAAKAAAHSKKCAEAQA